MLSADDGQVGTEQLGEEPMAQTLEEVGSSSSQGLAGHEIFSRISQELDTLSLVLSSQYRRRIEGPSTSVSVAPVLQRRDPQSFDWVCIEEKGLEILNQQTLLLPQPCTSVSVNVDGLAGISELPCPALLHVRD